jgi:hypothetical protein
MNARGMANSGMNAALQQQAGLGMANQLGTYQAQLGQQAAMQRPQDIINALAAAGGVSGQLNQQALGWGGIAGQERARTTGLGTDLAQMQLQQMLGLGQLGTQQALGMGGLQVQQQLGVLGQQTQAQQQANQYMTALLEAQRGQTGLQGDLAQAAASQGLGALLYQYGDPYATLLSGLGMGEQAHQLHRDRVANAQLNFGQALGGVGQGIGSLAAYFGLM